MFNAYFLRYRIRLDRQDRFVTTEIFGHYRSAAQVRREFEGVCPVIFEDEETQGRVRFKLFSVRENPLGPYYDC